MTPEEFEKLKEAEKEHLRSLRRLKKLAREVERKKKLADAVSGMTDEKTKLFDENDQLIEKLTYESAHQEARMELAMEAAADELAKSPENPPSAELEEEVRKARAKLLVESMKTQIGTPTESRGDSTDTSETEDSTPTEKVTKTIGRIELTSDEAQISDPESAEEPSAEESPMPEKTIGRVKRKK